MPTSEEILAGLHTIANEWQLLAVIWHAYFALLMLGLILNVRPTGRATGVFLIVPLLSVSMLAWFHSNPFNGTFFALTGIILLVATIRFEREPVGIAPWWMTLPGAFMVGFGWVYPHFLGNSSAIHYLYAAPTGLIPCPTLSIVIGFTLMLGGLKSQLWCVVLAIGGLFYGVFGALKLGVTIDWVLTLGALAAGYAAFHLQRYRPNAVIESDEY